MPTLSVPDMSCGHCRAAITEAIEGLDVKATLDFDMDARTVSLTTTASIDAAIDALDDVEFPATAVD